MKGSMPQIQTDGVSTVEQHGYFPVEGAHLYTVLHRVPDPVASVVLVGSFAVERHVSYVPWARWARYLASNRIECLRYDYRGVGESTGAFEDMSFEKWIADIELLAAWLKDRSSGIPLVLHGLELGALLASKAFAHVGDALLLWAPPKSAQQLLRTAFLRRIAVDNLFKDGSARRPAAEYFQDLETAPLEVGGYQWSSKLWHEALDLELPFGIEDERDLVSACSRPVRVVGLDKSAAPLVNGSMYASINPDLSALFDDNLKWITSALAVKMKEFQCTRPLTQESLSL